MNPALWGSLTALGWGSADFIARFTGRAMGHEQALFGMLSVSAVVLSLILWQADAPLVLEPGGWWLLLLTGVGIMLATLLLYWALTRGPVSIAAPISASYPVLNVAFAYLLGSRPSPVQWIGIPVVVAGVIAVARASRSFERHQDYTAEELRKTIAISLAASLTFAATVAAGQAAAPIYGELQTVSISRWIGLVVLGGLLFGIRGTPPRIPARWWPVLTAQGMLDGGAYVALFASGHLPRAEIAIVVASAYCAVTAVLARIFLREPVTGTQWLGILLIVAGVAALSTPG